VTAPQRERSCLGARGSSIHANRKMLGSRLGDDEGCHAALARTPAASADATGERRRRRPQRAAGKHTTAQ